ncbi:spore germination protein GerPE [Bacillus salitolerans]|uniref:Spore germination protein GerPE n=1 Tax=Bacillus salitolerans TaxID=1437434 RepID=A0ABW4LJY3_9BACI
MYHRTSVVNNCFVNSISFSSIFEIGDAFKIDANTKAIAVQREYPYFLDDEADFSSYPIFTEPIPTPVHDEDVRTTFIHENPVISVSSTAIIGLSSSSIFQIGSTNHIQSEARIKHIRQLLPREEE